MRQRWIFLVLLGAMCVACGGGEEPQIDPKNYTVRGMFARVEDNGMITVRHEEIPGYMDAMTMPFKVADANLHDGLQYGDKIEFNGLSTFEVDGQGALRSDWQALCKQRNAAMAAQTHSLGASRNEGYP